MTGIHTPPWRVRLATTAAAWLVAFATVMALLTAIGDQLQTLPPALRALVISGVLVALMANVFMPVIGALAHRRLTGKERS
jgi:antibiotic biosynthesis monooxygenase (ABM) superfamily enzyme